MFGKEKMPSIKKEMERVGTPERRKELEEELAELERKIYDMPNPLASVGAYAEKFYGLTARAQEIRDELKRHYDVVSPAPLAKPRKRGDVFTDPLREYPYREHEKP